MRTWMMTTLLGLAACGSTGCVLPIYDGDQAIRTQQLITTSENLRMLKEDWHRFWFIDQPSHLSPLRTHGGIL